MAQALRTTSDECDAQRCSRRWASLIPAGELSVTIREAVFGLEPPDSYEAWERYPNLIRVCSFHLRQLRRSDGYTLGYRYRNGRLHAYIREEHF